MKNLSKSEQFLAGGASGISSAVCFQPFDVIRTNQQGIFVAQASSSSPKLRQTISQIYCHHGLGGFWRGTTPTLIRVGFGAGTYFSVLTTLMSTTLSDSKTKTFVCGALARVIAATILCPLTVVKARMEWDTKDPPKYRNTWHAVQMLRSTEGIAGFYRGLGATVVRDAPFSGLYLLFYHQLKDWLGPKEAFNGNSTIVNFVSGTTGALLATTITHPADTIKTRLQLPMESIHGPRQLSIAQAVARLWREEGVAGFFRGYVPRMTKRAFSTALTWTIYEEIARWSEYRETHLLTRDR